MYKSLDVDSPINNLPMDIENVTNVPELLALEHEEIVYKEKLMLTCPHHIQERRPPTCLFVP